MKEPNTKFKINVFFLNVQRGPLISEGQVKCCVLFNWTILQRFSGILGRGSHHFSSSFVWADGWVMTGSLAANGLIPDSVSDSEMRWKTGLISPGWPRRVQECPGPRDISNQGRFVGALRNFAYVGKKLHWQWPVLTFRRSAGLGWAAWVSSTGINEISRQFQVFTIFRDCAYQHLI